MGQRFHLLGLYPHSSLRKDMPQEWHFFLEETTLLELDAEIMSRQTF